MHTLAGRLVRLSGAAATNELARQDHAGCYRKAAGRTCLVTHTSAVAPGVEHALQTVFALHGRWQFCMNVLTGLRLETCGISKPPLTAMVAIRQKFFLLSSSQIISAAKSCKIGSPGHSYGVFFAFASQGIAQHHVLPCFSLQLDGSGSGIGITCQFLGSRGASYVC